MSEHHAVYRDGRVHVLAEMCSTCVFRPGNLMDLPAGRLAGMVRDACGGDGCIPCHNTIRRDDVAPAVCRGFFDRFPTTPLQMAVRLDLIEHDPAPPKP